MIKNYGFNTFATEEWLPLTEVLIDSILSFSKYTITVNCINFTHNFHNDRVISKFINIDNFNFYSICMTKWASLLNNPYDICAILDSDMVATKEIDNLFYDNENRIMRAKFPLLAKHPHNPFTNPTHAQHLKYLCSLFSNKNPKMNWVYACGLISSHHKPFVAELTDYIYYFHTKGIQTYIEDEGILNALLTKYEVCDDLGYNHIPNFTLIDAYMNNDINNKELYNSYLQYNCPVKFYLLHECKNPATAKSLLQQIKNKI